MPKKFAGENSKAVAAKARKESTKVDERQKKLKELEDAMWRDDDKLVQRKQQRKDDQDRKKQEVASRKAENKALLEHEVCSSKKCTNAPFSPAEAKLTRARIAALLNKARAAQQKQRTREETHLGVPLEENLNRVVIDGEHAHTVTEAISVLSMKDEGVDRHPEKRMKAAYTEYEDRRLKELKEEKPTLRLSQLKQIIFKEWQKHPDNPINN